ncbi:peptidylprolyl isomerase [Clostridium sp. ATCC 25772]|uniref:peptidylprolyl isomerase n=1 Tax=Clostridium sp. ATCC 25772 TaxID=1676991 RepID=UPI000A5A4842|nr:peptidylprolyl isomerase [Clostridium sp. ATCC 25772]
MSKKYIALILLIIIGVTVVLSGCTKKEEDKEEVPTVVKSEKGENGKNPIAQIELEDGSVIKAELYPDLAPNTVRNFISLANSNFYDGLIFHRVIKGFMIQGGDPQGDGTGGPGYTIKGEFKENGFEQNVLKHEKGVLSMARAQDPDSAGSQFFIMHEVAPHLDDQYAAFGKVVEGLEVVDKIANVETDKNDKPVKEIKIKKITVDTFGVQYNEPEKVAQ